MKRTFALIALHLFHFGGVFADETLAPDQGGLIEEPDWAYQDGVTWYEPTERIVPESFDLRDLMKNGVPEIKKQKCGDCWAWSTHHALEIARAVHDNQVHDHSIQTVLSCSRAGSCMGGYMRAVDFLKYGLPYESQFPYAGMDLACKFSSGQIQMGWDAKVIGTPNIGSSRSYSRALRLPDGSYPIDRFEDREGTKVQNMIAAMHQWKSPLVVSVANFNISGGGVYDICGSINSGGNHMVAIVGWEMHQGRRLAHVWNSYGPTHGVNGVSRFLWECGDGQLNRGLGYNAKIVQYKSPKVRCAPVDVGQKALHHIAQGGSVKIGAPQAEGISCQWFPTEGLANPNSCVTTANPDFSTEYHLTAETSCGKTSSMTYVNVSR